MKVTGSTTMSINFYQTTWWSLFRYCG